jgi:anthranilate phosphoribosyltransferase
MQAAFMKEPEDMKALLRRAAEGERFSIERAQRAFTLMMAGEATPAQMGAFLMALRVRGETVDEITGGALALRARVVRVAAPSSAIDTCGTGGDERGSFNISTAAALVIAGAGVPVAKHGNRAVSSHSGSADVLAALGVNLDAEVPLIEESLRMANIGFMMAPRHHGAMRHVAPARVELGVRTIFNLLGPLSNPAGAKRQLLGVFAPEWLEPMALVLRNLGSERVWVVHGSDGLDELTTTGPSQVAELRSGTVRRFEITPEEVGLARTSLDALRGGDGEQNARLLRELLDGAKGPLRDIVLLNSAAALVIADKTSDLKSGLALAARAIDTGRARAALEALIAITNRPPAEP